jgi:uncharacterized RDD family membrane protein YckC
MRWFVMIRGWCRCRVVAAALAMMLACGVAAAAGDRGMLAASSDEHVWLVVEEPLKQDATRGRGAKWAETQVEPAGTSRVALLHHAAAMTGPHYRAIITLPQWPGGEFIIEGGLRSGSPSAAALAAWADRLWIAFPPRVSTGEVGPSIFTVQVVRHALNQRYYLASRDRLEPVAPLPAGRLQSIIATAEGPWALLAGATEEPRELSTGRSLGSLRLVRLKADRWVDVALPADAALAAGAWLVAVGDDGHALWLLTEARDGLVASGTWQLHRLGAADEWLSSSLDIRGRVELVLRVGGRPAVLTSDEAGGELTLSYLRPQGLIHLASFMAPAAPWAMVGLRDGARLITTDASAERTDGTGPRRRLAHFDAATGALHDLGRLEPQPLAAWRMLHIPVLVALAVTVLLVVFLFRPAGPGPPALPRRLVPLTVTARLAALAGDLLIGGFIAVLLMRCPVSALIRLPLLTTTLEETLPFMLMLGLTMLHSTAGELARGRTIGKAMVDAWVVDLRGERPGTGAILLRNAFKCVILFIPPLAIFALLNPNTQSLGDLVARTVVVRRVPAEKDKERPT